MKEKKTWLYIVFFCLFLVISIKSESREWEKSHAQELFHKSSEIKAALEIFYAKGSEETQTSPGTLYALSAVLMDGSSGRVLYEKNGEDFMANASTTKILTCILALENAELTEVVKVSSYAASMPDVQLHIKEGEQYYLGDLLYSLMLESHNDVAVAIAEHISGSQEEFSKLMNQKAREIGCKNTMFLTPNGLDATQKVKTVEKEEVMPRKIQENKETVAQNIVEKNKEGMAINEKEITHGTTAADLALIMRYCIKLSPKKEEFLKITQTATHSFQNVEGNRSFSCRNHNAFLNMMEGAVSGKTGFTSKAGYCYVGALEQQGECYIVALLACGWPGNKNYKWVDCRKLMNYGLETYESFVLNQLEPEVASQLVAEVKNAKREEIDGAAKIQLIREKSEISKVLLKENEEISVQIEKKELTAPVEKKQEAGKVIYYIEGEKWLEETLYCEKNVEKVDFKWCIQQILGKTAIGIKGKE